MRWAAKRRRYDLRAIGDRPYGGAVVIPAA